MRRAELTDESLLTIHLKASNQAIQTDESMALISMTGELIGLRMVMKALKGLGNFAAAHSQVMRWDFEVGKLTGPGWKVYLGQRVFDEAGVATQGLNVSTEAEGGAMFDMAIGLAQALKIMPKPPEQPPAAPTGRIIVPN